MVKIKQSIIINAPLDKVFQLAADYNQDKLWRKGVIDMGVTRIDEKDWTTTKTNEELRFLFLTYKTKGYVPKFEKNKIISFQSLEEAHEAFGDRIFKKIDENKTELIFDLTIILKDYMRLIDPITKIVFGLRIKQDLKRLKRVLERGKS